MILLSGVPIARSTRQQVGQRERLLVREAGESPGCESVLADLSRLEVRTRALVVGGGEGGERRQQLGDVGAVDRPTAFHRCGTRRPGSEYLRDRWVHPGIEAARHRECHLLQPLLLVLPALPLLEVLAVGLIEDLLLEQLLLLKQLLLLLLQLLLLPVLLQILLLLKMHALLLRAP